MFPVVIVGEVVAFQVKICGSDEPERQDMVCCADESGRRRFTNRVGRMQNAVSDNADLLGGFQRFDNAFGVVVYIVGHRRIIAYRSSMGNGRCFFDRLKFSNKANGLRE